MERIVSLPNFVECHTVDDANKVDLAVYTFVGLRKEIYVFKVRQK